MSDERKPTPCLVVILQILFLILVGYVIGIRHFMYLARVHGAAHYAVNEYNDAEFRWGPKVSP